MRCYIISLIAFFAIPIFVQAQNPIILLTIPKKYSEFPDGDLDQIGKRRATSFWIVFSDRDNNKALDKPESGSVINTVNFMDKFYVTGENAEYLELYKWEDGIKIQGEGKKILLNPNKAKRIGWIKKENLLLWSRSIVNKTSGFIEKGLIGFGELNIQCPLISSKKNNDLLSIYSHPNLQTQTNNRKGMFQLLYVYKHSGTSVLVGKTYKTNTYRIETDIIGWIDDCLLQKWDTRFFIEPNRNETAIAERKNIGIKASLFANKEDATAWTNGKNDQILPLWNYDPFEKTWPGSIKRFPVFKKDGNMVQTGFYAPMFISKYDNKTDPFIERNQIIKENNKVLNNLKKINIVFVIDAGFGMKNWAGTITNSLNQLIKKRVEMAGIGEKRNLYNYGSVVFRSMEDKACPAGDLSIGKFSLAANTLSLFDFLNNELKKEGCSNNVLKKDVNTALIEALKMIKDANKESNQSNYIFFIGGGTGNIEADSLTIPGLIAKYHVNLSLYHLDSSSQGLSEKVNSNYIHTIANASSIEIQKKELLMQANFNYKLTHILDSLIKNPVIESIAFSKINDSILSEQLVTRMNNSLLNFEQNVEASIKSASSLIYSFQYNDSYIINPLFKNQLHKAGIKVNDKDIFRKFNNIYEQFFIPAWATISTNKLEKPIFNYGMYVSEDELYETIENFDKLNVEGSPTEIREELYQAYQSLFTVYFGVENRINEKLQSKIEMNDLLTKITGLPFSSSDLLKGIKINEIKDPSKVSDEKIAAAVKRIQQSYEALKTVSRDINETMRDASEEGVYYWIPEEYFPH